MPSRIQLKLNIGPNQTFHVTSRGITGVKPFANSTLKGEFLSRLEKYLSPTVWHDASRRPYEKLFDEVAVLAFCVLDNHYHLVLHQFTADGMRKLMSRVLVGHAKMFNNSQIPRRRGPIFDGRYAADPLRDSDHLREMIGYTVLNDPMLQLDNKFCSNAHHLGERQSTWLRNDLTIGVFGGTDGYREYMNRTGPKRVSNKLRRWGVDPTDHPYRPI